MDYSELCEIYEKLEKTTKRLEKIHIVAEFLSKVHVDELDKVVLLLNGTVFPDWDEREFGIADRMVIKIITQVSGEDTSYIEKTWKKTGDLGDVAFQVLQKRKQRTLHKETLTIKNVFNSLQGLFEITGEGSVDKKIQEVAKLLSNANPSEAKYLIRTVLENLRAGAGEGVLRDALVYAFVTKDELKHLKEGISDEARKKFNQAAEKVRHGLDVKNDFGEVALILKKQGLEGLEEVSLNIFNPIKAMLFQKAEGLEDAFETVGKPCAFEYKVDGFRMQVHKQGDKIKLYTRRLDDVSNQFPDVVKAIKENVKSKSCILDCEIIGINKKTGKWKPFQEISQRIKRKHNIERIVEELPVMINIFDAMMIDGKSLINTKFSERRKILEKTIHEKKNVIQSIRNIITDSLEEANDFYQESLLKGNEGIMAKNLDSPYKPGSRVGYGMKIKPVMENLDLVIVAAEWGEGKRSEWLSSFTVACQDDEKNTKVETGKIKLLTIGKVSTGLKEKEEEGTTFREMTRILKPLIISEHGKTVNVKPKIIIEVSYEEIQTSPTYESGFALRFPRVKSLREDKPVSEISTLSQIKKYAEHQRARKK